MILKSQFAIIVILILIKGFFNPLHAMEQSGVDKVPSYKMLKRLTDLCPHVQYEDLLNQGSDGFFYFLKLDKPPFHNSEIPIGDDIEYFQVETLDPHVDYFWLRRNDFGKPIASDWITNPKCKWPIHYLPVQEMPSNSHTTSKPLWSSDGTGILDRLYDLYPSPPRRDNTWYGHMYNLKDY